MVQPLLLSLARAGTRFPSAEEPAVVQGLFSLCELRKFFRFRFLCLRALALARVCVSYREIA